MKIYTVIYQDYDEEPAITAFDNYKSAELCYQTFKNQHNSCYLDEVLVNHSFKVF